MSAHFKSCSWHKEWCIVSFDGYMSCKDVWRTRRTNL
jgi:hypothetical protein